MPLLVSETLRIFCITEKETGSDCDIAVRVNTVLTSYWLIPVGTNSGALAESRDVLAMESTAGGALLPLAFCRGLFGFFTSKRGHGHRLLVPTSIPQGGNDSPTMEP